MPRPKGSKSDPNRTPVDFKQSNVTRVVRAAQSLGLPISGIEVEPGTGKIRVLVGNAGTGDNHLPPAPLTDWDKKLAQPS